MFNVDNFPEVVLHFINHNDDDDDDDNNTNNKTLNMAPKARRLLSTHIKTSLKNQEYTTIRTQRIY